MTWGAVAVVGGEEEDAEPGEVDMEGVTDIQVRYGKQMNSRKGLEINW